MIRDVTDKAVTQLLLMAAAFHVPQEQVIFKVEGKMRMPCQLVWYITPVGQQPSPPTADITYLPRQIKGLNFAVESDAAIFLVNVVIDYDERLLEDENLYDPTTIDMPGKPVWPRGFVFEHQTDQYIMT